MSMELEQEDILEQFKQLITTEDKIAIRDFLNVQNISDVAELIYAYPDDDYCQHGHSQSFESF